MAIEEGRTRLHEDAIPERLGRYDVVLPIATGGMATVYLARAHGLGGFDRYLALKLTAAHLRRDPNFSAHLIEEAKLVAHLRHPNVVQPFDVGECEDGVFLVMEYVPGDSFAGLRSLARRAGAPLPRGVGLKILIDALHGLEAAHEHTDEDGHPLHLVHRDFSPQNILVGTDGIARLTDFGIAKAASRVSNTAPGFVKGKLTYIAPEQAGPDAVDRRCDIWAAGVIAWEILAGRKLYDKNDIGSLGSKRPDPPRVATVASDVSAELDEIIGRALRVDRDQRPASALAFARELAAAAAAAGTLATEEEVAAHVVRLVGPELAERKQLLAEARREHKKRPLSTPDVRTMIGMAGPPPTRRAPLPSLPEIPVQVDDEDSQLKIAVDLGGGSADRAGAEILGDFTPAVPHEVSVFRSPLDPRALIAPIATDELAPRESHDPVASPIGGLPVPLLVRVRGAVQTLATATKPWLTPPWTTKKVSVAAGVGGGLVGFAIVLIALSSRSSSSKPGADADADVRTVAMASAGAPRSHGTAPTSEGAGAATATGESAKVSAHAPAATSVAEASEARMLVITADGPIASVRVGDRFVDAIVPAPKLTVDLEDDEIGATLRIVVTSTDGRLANVTATTATTGTAPLDVRFGDRPTPARAPAPAPTPTTTTKHPWSKHSR